MLYANSRIPERERLRPRNDLVVLGCSFAALEFLYRTARRRGPFSAGACTVVEPAAAHTYLPLAHEVASGVAKVADNTFDAARFCGALGATWEPHAAVSVDPTARHVVLDDGRHLEFARLIIAVGSVADIPPAFAEHPNLFAAKNPDDALRLRERVTTRDTVTVIGAGITGVEWSAELSQCARVVLITDTAEILPTFARGIQRHAARRLERLGVTVRTGRRVGEIDGDLEGAIVVWAGGVRANPVLAAFGLPLTSDGHLRVDDRLGVSGFPGIYGIGDAIRPSGDRAIDAIWQGAWLARNIDATGRAYTSGRTFFYGISLGRYHSIILRGPVWADTPLFVGFRRRLRAAYYARFTLMRRWYALEHALDRRDDLARRTRLR